MSLPLEQIIRKLGAAQRRGLLALPASGSFGNSGEFEAMKRLWYRDDIPRLVDHMHRTDDCWALRDIGLEVRTALKQLDQAAQWKSLADRAIAMVEAAVQDTDWGQPTFGPDYGEELRAAYLELERTTA